MPAAALADPLPSAIIVQTSTNWPLGEQPALDPGAGENPTLISVLAYSAELPELTPLTVTVSSGVKVD